MRARALRAVVRSAGRKGVPRPEQRREKVVCLMRAGNKGSREPERGGARSRSKRL